MCAYVIPEKVKDFYSTEVKDYLQERLPYYMVPSRVLPVEKFPLTHNGKIDKKALPDPDFTAETEYLAPRNRVEELLAQLWAEVLNIRKETIGINSNFFELGGHSLRATMLVSKIEKELDVKIQIGHFFNVPTIQQLSGLINTTVENNQKFLQGETRKAQSAEGKANNSPGAVRQAPCAMRLPPGRRRQKSIFRAIESVEKQDYYPVSSQQKRLYTLRQFGEEGTAYNVFSTHWLKGNVDVERIERSFLKLIEKHEAFRTGFRMLEGEPVQKIWDRVEWKLDYEELKDQEMVASYIQESKVEFDLSHPPLLRVKILKVTGNEYLMLVDMHHIIADGSSTAILVNELAKAYQGTRLEPLMIQYKDYAVWQQELQEEPEFRKQEAYWVKRYEGEIPVLNLPTDFPRPPLQSFEGSQCDFQLSQSFTNKLKQMCKEYDLTLYMMLLACYQVLLAKYSGQDDVVVGSPVAGRDHADTQGIAGMFVNTLAIRTQPAGEKEFSSYLAEIKQISIEAYENQGYPFEELLEKVKVTRDVSRNPLFDTMFVLQNIEMEPLKMGEIEIMPYRNMSDTAKFDLIFAASEFEEKITCTIEYCIRLFKKETVNRLGMHYCRILEDVLKKPGCL
jgi:bacitracin synthase 3